MPFDVGQGKPFYTYWENNADFANSGAQDAGFNLAQWLWMRDSGFPTAAQAPASPGVNAQPRFGANLAQYLPQAQAAGQPAQPMPYSGNLQMGGFMPGQMSGLPFQPTAYGWPFGQQNVQQGGQRPAQPPFMLPQPQLPAMQQMQPTNPFGAMGLQAYQQQLGGQAGGLLRPTQPQPPAAPSQPAPGAPRSWQEVSAQRRDQRRADKAQERAAENAAKPWFLQEGKASKPQGLTREQERQYMDARAKAQQQYYMQNPSQIPAGMLNQPGTMGKFWSALAGNYAPFMAKGQELANRQQGLYDKYQTVLNQQSNIASNPAFNAFQQSWNAIPAGARGKAAQLTPQQAYAATTALGLPWNALPMGNDASIDVFLNGPMSQQDAAKYYGQHSLNMGRRILGR